MIKSIVKDQQLLQQPAIPATKNDLPLAQDLIDTLTAHQKECIGMAANMIGSNKNAIIVCIGPLKLVMFNPTITAKKGAYQVQEGCLSLKGIRSTTRFKEITVHFQNQAWQQQTLTLTDLPAEIVQHEVDHCHGIII